jgi:hypothetical protein
MKNNVNTTTTTLIDSDMANKAIDNIQAIVDCMKKRIETSDKKNQVEVSIEMSLFLTNFLNKTDNDCFEVIKKLDI